MSHPLFPVDHPAYCEAQEACPLATVVIDGQTFITFGHCGFNSKVNNGRGYATEAFARAAIRRFSFPRPARRVAEPETIYRHKDGLVWFGGAE